jgi:(4S)-4-hydroxy-5-phosphonooxypentane-2,3-dione isomerase
VPSPGFDERSTTPIVIFTRLVARPGRRDEVLEAFAPFLAAVADEPGTEFFAAHTARDDADVLLCYEVYRDDAALAAHRESEAVRDLVARLGDLLAGPPEVVYASRVGSSSPSS